MRVSTVQRFRTLFALLFVAAVPAMASAADGDTVFASSLWTKKAQQTTGLYSIEQRADGYTLSLSADFKTRKAPDLKIILSPHTPEQATAKNALVGGVVVAALKSNSGAQDYTIDPSVDLGEYRSVLIHCEQYTKLWSAAPLHEGAVIARGDVWKKKTKKTKGAFEIAQTENGNVIRFADNFKTAKAPEPLRIVLSEHTTKSASNKNAMNQGRVVAMMNNYKGGQTHELPEDLEIKPGMTLLLHCEKYTKLWSAAEITIVGD